MLKRRMVLLLVFVCLAFTACDTVMNKKTDDTNVDKSESDKTEAENAKELPKKDSESDVTKGSGFFRLQDNMDVDNNGGEFVKVGKRVYFRKFSFDNMNSIANNAKYRQDNHVGIQSEFGYLDLDNNEFVKLFDDEGFGKIFYMDGRLYLSMYKHDVDEYTPLIYSVDLEGKDRKEVVHSNLKAVYPKKKYLIIEDNSGVGIYKPNAKVEYAKSEDQIYYFQNLIGDKLIYSSLYSPEGGAATQSVKLYCVDLNASGKVILLGEIDNADFSECNIDVVNFREADGKLWIGVEFLSGSGQFFYAGEVYSADLNRADSIKSEAHLDLESGNESLPDFDIINGAVKFYDIASKTIFTRGGAVFYNDQMQGSDDVASFKIYEKVEIDNSESNYSIELAERVGDEIYIVVNKNMEYAQTGTFFHYYKLVNTEYLRYDLMNKKLSSIFGLISNPAPQGAFIWVSKNSDEDALVFQLAHRVDLSDMYQRRFYNLEDDEANEGFKVVRLLSELRKVKLSPDFVLEYLDDKDGSTKSLQGDLQAFRKLMEKKKVSLKLELQVEPYQLPNGVGTDLSKLIYADLYFDAEGENVVKIVEIAN